MQLIANTSTQKLRGGFYTPKPIVDFLLKWGLSDNKKSVILEPSCGDGVFLNQIKAQQFSYQSIKAIELEATEAIKSQNISLANCSVIQGDFHTYCNQTTDRFDLVIGNPPYIRYQFFDKQQQIEAATIFNKAGLKYSKLTNAWVSFVVGSSLLLKDSGKIGFVLPAELLQVSYAKPLRQFLASFYNKINIISFKKLIFPNIQQEVILLLCEKNNSGKHHIEHLELYDAQELNTLDQSKLKSPQKQIDFKSNKWTFYFLTQEEINFLENIAKKRNIPTIKDYAKVEVGITTGANAFFTVPLSTVEAYHLSDYARPMVGRSVQVNSVVFKEIDWQKNKYSKARAHLLVFPEQEKQQQKNGAAQYINYGESQGIHKGYKTSIRDYWYVVPSLKISDALFIRRNNLYPKLIVNEAKAYTTDTMHRVFLHDHTHLQAFTASYYNSLSLAFTEVCGRSHGGGVLELMPKEAERILLPYHIHNQTLLHKIDDLMRKKTPIDEILAVTNPILLKENYGLTDTEIQLAHNIWKKLSSRRLNRKR